MRIRDWSSDVCSSDLALRPRARAVAGAQARLDDTGPDIGLPRRRAADRRLPSPEAGGDRRRRGLLRRPRPDDPTVGYHRRSEEHTSELQSLMRISYAVFCLTKTNNTT